MHHYPNRQRKKKGVLQHSSKERKIAIINFPEVHCHGLT